MAPQTFKAASVLIAGASGFLGRHLAAAIAEHSPADLTLLSRSAATPAPRGARSVVLNLFDRDATRAFIRENRFDVVYNLAGKIDQTVWPGVYDEQFKFHVQTTLNLTDAFIENPPDRFIHLGSSMEYGNAPYPQLNVERENPLSAYGVSKLAATKLVIARTHSEQLPGVVLRPFMVYGKGQGRGSFLSQALAAAREGREFSTTDGDQTRDFTPVDKFIEDTLAISSLSAAQSIGQIFNICTGVEIRLRDVLMMLKEIYPAFSPRLGAIPYRSSEVMHSVGAAFRPWTDAEARSNIIRFLREKL